VPADRSRRLATWAAAVARAPIATPGTVPWENARPWNPPGSPPADGGRGTAAVESGGATRAGEPAATATTRPGSGFGEVARRELAELVVAGREVVVERLAELSKGDPARKHAKRIRRARRAVRAKAGVAAGFAMLAGVAVAAPGPEITEYGLGAAALVVGWRAVGSGRRLARLRREPAPPPRPDRPPKDSPARGPLDRLAHQEQALHGLLAHLGDVAAEPRRVAAGAAAGLRELGARLTAVDRAHRLSGRLDDAVGALQRQLLEGLAAFDALVVAAADAVAADAGLRTPAPLREATDALAGYAAGLRDVGAWDTS
jgi:hypothetical protein